jgi:hypothetical protein
LKKTIDKKYPIIIYNEKFLSLIFYRNNGNI